MNTREEWAKRWPHFTPTELLSTEQLWLFEHKGVIPYSFRALDKLETFREFVNTTIIVNKDGNRLRGARSLREVYHTNKQSRKVGKEWGYSFHLWCAFDINIPGFSPFQVMGLALDSKLWHGVGVYDTFTHIDDRDTFSGTAVTWDYRKEK